VRYKISLTKKAQKDLKKLSPKLLKKAKEIIRNFISKQPYNGKHLLGDMKDLYSVRLSYQDRILYSIEEKEITVHILRAKTHYGE